MAVAEMGQGMSDQCTYPDDNQIGYSHDAIKIGGSW